MTASRALATAVLLVLGLSGCGGGDEVTSSGTAAAVTSAAATETAAATGSEPSGAAAAGEASAAAVAVKGKGMKGGCDALHKLLLALDDGDMAAVEAYRTQAEDLFNAVADLSYKDLDTALLAAPLASTLEQEAPTKEGYALSVAPMYTEVCVGKYAAPALT